MIGGATRLVGLIGDPVAHSLSPRIQNAAFAAEGLDWAYVPLRVSAPALDAALAGLAALGFVGANVTVPHKEAVAARCHTLSDVARAAGSVNTLLVRDDGTVSGDSTDGAAVLEAVEAVAGPEPLGGDALVLGAGGAARAAAAALAGAGATVRLLARRPEAAAATARALAPLGAVTATERLPPRVPRLVVNATPLGGASALEEMPLPADLLTRDHVVVDLSYRPDLAPTPLCRRADEVGARVVDGLEILLRQGALAFSVWTGRPSPLDVMRRALDRPDPAGR